MLHAVIATALALLPSTVRAEPVPILMYHVIAAPPATALFSDLFVRPRDFARQIRWLARHGYHAVTLDRVYDHWTRGVPLPPRPVVISFDDGYLSQFTHGFATLRRYHWPADLNLQVDFLRPATGMRPWRVRELIAAGWEIDAHTFTHPDLTTLDDRRLWHEVDGSRVAIRRLFHVPADFFCYPAGRYDARVVNAVRLAGYLGATTTAYGVARPPAYYTLPRIRVAGRERLPEFATVMEELRP